ncbi:hypothetical protein BDW62DRAFT_188961 [Aspergillus aurantiobrunneus]
MPVILLATPLINILESFYPDHQSGVRPNVCGLSHNRPLAIARPCPSSPELNPDQNYYQHSTAMGAGTAYILLCELAFTGFFLFSGFDITLVVAAARYLRIGLIIPPIAL